MVPLSDPRHHPSLHPLPWKYLYHVCFPWAWYPRGIRLREKAHSENWEDWRTNRGRPIFLRSWEAEGDREIGVRHIHRVVLPGLKVEDVYEWLPEILNRPFGGFKTEKVLDKVLAVQSWAAGRFPDKAWYGSCARAHCPLLENSTKWETQTTAFQHPVRAAPRMLKSKAEGTMHILPHEGSAPL